jgi:hypothetical protein
VNVSEWRQKCENLAENLPGDNGDLAGETELLQGRSEGAVDTGLEGSGLDLDVLNGRNDRLGLVDLDVKINTLALLIGDDVDRVLLGGLILADNGLGESAEGSDAGRRAPGRDEGGAVGGLKGAAHEERHDGSVECGLCACRRLWLCNECVAGWYVVDEGRRKVGAEGRLLQVGGC